jgi:hypothetical protein
MKVDKESFIKHHFWYLLGILIPLTFLAMILLWTGTAGAIDSYEKKFETGKKSIETLAKGLPKNQKWVDTLNEKKKHVLEEKDKIWKEMWGTQADIMTWPDAVADKFKDMKFGDKISPRDRNTYSKDDVYTTQYRPVIEVVEPVRSDGSGVVQCPTGLNLGDWYNFLHFKRGWANSPPATEDIWLAQEEMWLCREMLKIVRDANDMTALMRKVTSAATTKAGDEIDRQVFESPTWKLEIALVTHDNKYFLRYRLTNQSRRRQWLGLNFEVAFKGTQLTDTLHVDDEPLAPDKSLEGPEQALGLGAQFGNPTGIESVRQVLDWKTAPVKRIDRLELVHQSARNAEAQFQAETFPLLKADVSQGASTPGEATSEGFRRKRYLQVTPEVRRFAVGLLCVVEQDAMQDLLTAFANSRLHIQTMQYHWQRYYNDVKPAITPVVVRPDATKGARVPVRGPAPAPATRGADDRDMELVQLAMYGVASLYERYQTQGEKPPGEKPEGEKARAKK